MNGKSLAEALRKGQHVYGTAMVSQSPLWPGILASLGMDLVFIDTEHTALNRETVGTICHLYKGCKIAPLVRIPAPDPYQATMVLDGGAAGVIAPYVESAEQVRQLVGAVKYKPLKGQKLQASLVGKASLEPELAEYLQQHNQGNVLIVNIESTPALEALDEILSVEGLDAILIGPHDLTCSLGIPEQYHHPLFIQTVDGIIEKARKNQIGVGIHIWDEVGFDQEIRWAKQGANLIMHSNDLSLFSSAMGAGLQNIKKALGQPLPEGKATDHTI